MKSVFTVNYDIITPSLQSVLWWTAFKLMHSQTGYKSVPHYSHLVKTQNWDLCLCHHGYTLRKGNEEEVENCVEKCGHGLHSPLLSGHIELQTDKC